MSSLVVDQLFKKTRQFSRMSNRIEEELTFINPLGGGMRAIVRVGRLQQLSVQKS